MVVFGFLDSHTLLSSFSSVRLDNFVYTKESMEQVHHILLPEGTVQLTFASNRMWIHTRLIALLDQVFDESTEVALSELGFANGMVYTNRKTDRVIAGDSSETSATASIPTDDWPFLYLEKPTIPKHYLMFIALATILGFASLLLLPRGERQIRFPYFFLGAGFFLIETSNIVSLSLLYGSTWYVNVVVFTGILVLVLLGNLTSHLVTKPRINLYIALITASIALAFFVPISALLSIESGVLRTVSAVFVFLGPVYFAALIFATLIKSEKNLYQAYGSNVLGAVVGGVCEYLSLVMGFKFLLAITLAFYLAVFLQLRKKGSP